MSYWVVHREQVSLELQIDEFENKDDANDKRNYLQQHYYDSVILDQNDINELYWDSFNMELYNKIKKIKMDNKEEYHSVSQAET